MSIRIISSLYPSIYAVLKSEKLKVAGKSEDLNVLLIRII